MHTLNENKYLFILLYTVDFYLSLLFKTLLQNHLSGIGVLVRHSLLVNKLRYSNMSDVEVKLHFVSFLKMTLVVIR